MPCTHRGRNLHPAGDAADLRRVLDEVSGVFLCKIILDQIEGICYSQCQTAKNPLFNTWVHVNCYAYLQNWLNCRLPPRVGRLGRPLTLPQELYGLVNSRREPQIPGTGALPCVDYGGTLGAYFSGVDPPGTEHYFQAWLMGARKGLGHIAAALQEGRPHEVANAVLEDCGFYMFLRPDM